MTPDAMLQMLSQPDMLRLVAIEDLRRIMETYPCFAMARMLYVKALKEQGDLDYPQELFKASLQAPSRRQLFYCINGRKSLQGESQPSYVDEYPLEPAPAADNTASSQASGFSLIDKFLEEQPLQDCKQSRNATLNQIPVYDIEESLGDGSDVEEDNEIIRRFLETNRTLPVTPEEPLQEPAPSVDVPVMPEAAFTLTLARIYIRQKKYESALEIFRSMVLKNPEKSIYFADQIRYLEKVINHLKK